MYLSQTEPSELTPEPAPEVSTAEPRGQSHLGQIVRWILVLGAGAFLAWHILALGMAEYYAETDPAKALAWDSHHPLALRNQATRLLAREPAQAAQLLREALRQNPSDARAYVMLAWLREKAGKLESARQLIEQASALGPRQWRVQLDVAAFWLRHGYLERALQSWNIALQMQRSLAKELFPALLKIAEQPALRQALFPLVRSAPIWWSDFFLYAVNNADQLETLRALYTVQREEGVSSRERQAFVARLQREGYWVEAYFTWLNALDTVELRALGNLFNGHFELPLADEGFGWRFSQPRGVEIKTASTYGISGEQALRVAFFGQRIRFHHLSQPLLLPPGVYQLAGKFRLDNLETARGLQWRVYCLAPRQQQIAASEPFLGASPWRHFNVFFEVPKEGCRAQLLRLELRGKVPLDFDIQGVAWFDSMAIERIEGNSQKSKSTQGD